MNGRAATPERRLVEDVLTADHESAAWGVAVFLAQGADRTRVVTARGVDRAVALSLALGQVPNGRSAEQTRRALLVAQALAAMNVRDAVETMYYIIENATDAPVETQEIDDEGRERNE